jgi:hypothetical protein
MKHVALENPDGRQVLVLTNPGAARVIELQLANMDGLVFVKGGFSTTLAWEVVLSLIKTSWTINSPADRFRETPVRA